MQPEAGVICRAIALVYGVGCPSAQSDRPASAARVIGLRGKERRRNGGRGPLRDYLFEGAGLCQGWCRWLVPFVGVDSGVLSSLSALGCADDLFEGAGLCQGWCRWLVPFVGVDSGVLSSLSALGCADDLFEGAGLCQGWCRWLVPFVGVDSGVLSSLSALGCADDRFQLSRLLKSLLGRQAAR